MTIETNNYAFVDSQNLNLSIQEYDKAVIVSGDGDFYCLLEYLEKQDKLQKLVIPNKYDFSSLLRKFSRYMLFMNGLKGKLGYKNDRK